jgi:arylsulfatase A-like enzyme
VRRPNIVFIVADDLGFADLGCYGGREAAFGPVSPQIDRLARAGLRLTQGYSNSPVCSPTRFALMTGRYQYRLRGAAEEPINSTTRGDTSLGLPPSHPSLPSILRDAGYRTALVGKWHLGFPPAFSPLKSGYDEFVGVTAGGVDYFTHRDSSGHHDLWAGESPLHERGYLTDLLSRRAVDFIERASRSPAPFFLSLHYTAPHWPWETRDDEARAQRVQADLGDLAGGNVETYRRMIHHMDEGIGAIAQRLRALGIDGNTLLVFTSDNGGERFSDNWPLVGGKMDLTEGGIRVPWVAHWPDVIAPGGVSVQPCMTMDWTATLLQAGGARVPPAGTDDALDGVSLLPLLHDAHHRFDRPMFWRMNHRGQRAHRSGDWKYLQVDGREYLFNLAHDERERANLAQQEPERFAALRDAWLQWNAGMPAIPPDATIGLSYSDRDMPQR